MDFPPILGVTPGLRTVGPDSGDKELNVEGTLVSVRIKQRAGPDYARYATAPAAPGRGDSEHFFGLRIIAPRSCHARVDRNRDRSRIRYCRQRGRRSARATRPAQ